MSGDQVAEQARKEYASLWRAQDGLRDALYHHNYLARRSAEAGWLVKRIKHPEDDNNIAIESVFNQVKPPIPEKRKTKASKVKTIDKLASFFHTPTSSKVPKIRKRLTPEEKEEAEQLAAAEALRERDQQQRLDKYLRKKVAKVRVLERVVNWLGLNKQPRHHCPVDKDGAIPIDLDEKNVRNYTIHP